MYRIFFTKPTNAIKIQIKYIKIYININTSPNDNAQTTYNICIPQNYL